MSRNVLNTTTGRVELRIYEGIETTLTLRLYLSPIADTNSVLVAMLTCRVIPNPDATLTQRVASPMRQRD